MDGRGAFDALGERDNVDVHAKLAGLRRAVEEARSMPMSATAVINRSELLELIDEVSGALEAAFTESQQVISERDAVVDEGRQQAQQIVAEAHSERENIISDTDVYRVAKREADHLIEQARAEADIGIDRASSTARRSPASFACTSTLSLSPSASKAPLPSMAGAPDGSRPRTRYS